jgi:nicotinate phosphoribosyltransferase
VTAAPDKLLVDFGLRRAHGAEAGLAAARASYLAGFEGTSNAAAAREFDIPAYGTMAHSFVQAHDAEPDAFINFARAQPDNVVLLIDTYDTEAAAHMVVELAARHAAAAPRIRTVRSEPQSVADMLEQDQDLAQLPGIGKDLAGKIATIVETGELPVLEKMRADASGIWKASAGKPNKRFWSESSDTPEPNSLPD